MTAQKMYLRILEVANVFLRNAQRFEVAELQDHNPSYHELAKIMKQVAGMIHDLVDEIDPMMAYQAIEYASLMEKIALAIVAGDQDELDRNTQALYEKPFLALER